MKPFSFLSQAINSYLALHPDAREPLAKLNDQTIQIELPPLPLSFQCRFKNNKLELDTDLSRTPDALIRGTPLQLLGLSLAPSDRRHFFTNNVVIEGDAALGQEMVNLLDALKIDWEDYLARYLGDAPAYHLSRLAGRFKNNLGDAASSLKEDVSEYLHEEAIWFPSKENLEDFFTEIDIIRDRVDRAEARLNQLCRLD